MQVTIETFSKKDTEYKVELGNLKDMVSNKIYPVELAHPNLESIKHVQDKFNRFMTVDLSRSIGMLKDLTVNDNKSITAEFVPNELYERLFKVESFIPISDMSVPKFGIRCLTKPGFSNSKPIIEVDRIITWDLVEDNGS